MNAYAIIGMLSLIVCKQLIQMIVATSYLLHQMFRSICVT